MRFDPEYNSFSDQSKVAYFKQLLSRGGGQPTGRIPHKWLSMFGFVLALTLSWFASNRIYSPVKRLMYVLAGGKTGGIGRNLDEFQLLEKQWGHLSRESRLLQNKLQEQLRHIREGFLLQLFHQYLNRYSEQELKNRMEQYGWGTEGRQFIVAHVQLTGFSQPDGRFTHDDRGLATFAGSTSPRSWRHRN